MLYAPRDDEELPFTTALLNTSYAMARGWFGDSSVFPRFGLPRTLGR
jgi:hypothetical protein